ncbi:MAG TPA: molybdenum cofactor biosynthesis protein MoaE [Solirubrobacterales bacterium]|jgi:molybdopterin synthase catalytic subunit
MILRVRLFAMLRERAGRDWVEIEIPARATVEDALRELSLQPDLGETVRRLPVRMAVNLEYADPETILRPEDELALIPPISGGAPIHARVVDEPLSADALSRRVADPAAGAIVCFQGVTRDVAMLEYEAYREMAEARIGEILLECLDRHSLLAAAAEHRVGPVASGEPGVVVAVSARHREEAFAGAREAIDRIKSKAPIWKREVGVDGSSSWVEGAPAPISGEWKEP